MRYKPIKNIKEKLLETGMYRYITQKPKSLSCNPKAIPVKKDGLS